VMSRIGWRDEWLLSLAGLLLLLGIVAVGSASIEHADEVFGDPWHHLRRHFIYLGMGLTAAALVAAVPLSRWQDGAWVVLLLALAMLVLVLIPGIGREVNGAQRWIPLGVFNAQPSEFAKFAMIVYLSSYLVRRRQEVHSILGGFFKPMMVLFFVTLLLLMEPDFGGAVVIAGSALGMLFLAGVRLWQFAMILAGVALAGAVLIVTSPYRWARLVSYTDPWADQFNSGYQLTQSLIAFGRGELFGVGLGNSVQKLFYLPEAHTDFVFAIWAEETGFVGSALLILLFAALIARIFMIARRAAAQGQLFAAHALHGVMLLLACQVFINVGVASGLLPTKGLTLPLISYGGSSLIACCALLGLALRCEAELAREEAV
jgi:cell division protein FtsW